MEPKQEPPEAQPTEDEWGLPIPSTHMDEPLEPELGCCADDDDEADPW